MPHTNGNLSGQLWSPRPGPETDQLLQQTTLAEADRKMLLEESVSILARCTDPDDSGPSVRAGLVVGGVQAGKTLSFTTVMALARDNCYQLVILIAGTKENLLNQSRARLAADLGLARGDAHYRWTHHKSPRPGTREVEHLGASLKYAIESQHGGASRTVLITVMKNHMHMANAAEVLRQLGQIVDMRAVTALVIDDEADQATPNLRRVGESAIYRNLRAIRAALPRHTLLEYTATPQAPLLVSVTDELSPDFAWVLTPGQNYTGGQFFFEDHRDTFLKVIPSTDLRCLDNHTLGPPESLLDALALFFVGAAATQLSPSGERVSQRSMVVHPSHATLPQAAFRSWLESTKRVWVQTLQGGGHDAEELARDRLRPAYEDLARSVEDPASWEAVKARLSEVMELARITEVNARGGPSPAIEWSQAYAWILIGGAMLDRGFTVEGLTVTYMPRGTGVGNADTLQQRARFFGYKRPYAGYCRAWLESDVADAFSKYVAHEESMRRQLRRVAEAGEPMRQWRRRFLLDPDLRPTRQAVIRLPLARWEPAGWTHQWHVPLPPQPNDIASRNQITVEHFLGGQQWSVEREVGATPMQWHDKAEVALAVLYQRLLVEMTFVESDHPTFLALMLSIEEFLTRHPDATAVVFNMSRGKPRERTLREADSTKIKGLLQGRSPDGSYRGDRAIRDDTRLTVQIHHIDVRTEQASTALVREHVPFLAIWTPRGLELEPAIIQTH